MVKSNRLLLILSLLMIIYFVGCSNDDQAKGSDDDVVDLRFFMWTGTPEEQEVWEYLSEKVTEEYPNIKVTFETDSFGNFWDKLQSQLASGTEADIIGIQSLRVGEFGPRGVYEPLDSFIEQTPEFEIEDFNDSILEQLSLNDDQLGIPYDFGPKVLFYNKDIFDKHGVEYPHEDMTWNDFLEKAQKTTKDNDYGYTSHARSFNKPIPWIWQAGGDYMDENTEKSMMADSETVEAIQFISDLHHVHEVIAPNNDPGNTTLSLEQFYNGNVAMIADGPWSITNFRQKTDFDWDVTLLPAGKAGSQTYVAGSGFGISSNSEHKKEAWKALTVILSKESIEYLASAGRGYPARESAIPAFVESEDGADAPPENIDIIQKAAETAKPYRTTTNWEKIDDMFVRELDAIWFDNEAVEDVLERVDEQLQMLLDEHQQNLSGMN